MPFTEHTLIDGGRWGVSIVAHIEYELEAASGDGWNEPRDNGGAYLISVTLEKVTTVRTFTGQYDANRMPVCSYETTREAIPGEAPDWVTAVLEDTEWWTEIESDDGPCPDYAYDTMRDRALTDRVA